MGAGIGVLVALQMNHFFWWVGAVVGGFVGYLTYDFKEVVKAVPHAWHRASSWRPSENLKGVVLWVITILFLGFFCWGSLATLLGFWFNEIPRTAEAILIIPLFMGFGLCLWALACFTMSEYLRNANLKEATIWALRETNPIMVLFWHLPRGCWYTTKWSVTVAIPTTRRFLKELFFLVHSDIRLLCGLDAALGACAGYFFGNALIGAIAGGIFGVLNYEIFSKKVLKVVPLKTN